MPLPMRSPSSWPIGAGSSTTESNGISCTSTADSNAGWRSASSRAINPPLLVPYTTAASLVT